MSPRASSGGAVAKRDREKSNSRASQPGGGGSGSWSGGLRRLSLWSSRPTPVAASPVVSTTVSPSEPVPEMTALEVVSAGDDAGAVEAAAERAKLGEAALYSGS